MKRLAFWVLTGALLHSAAIPADSAAPIGDVKLERIFVPHSEYMDSVEASFRAYQRKELEAAFEHMSKAARWGDKHAQYILALMYVFGDGTNVDFVTGLAWLEVANEAPNRKWRRDLSTMRKEASPEEQAEASALAARLIGYYGMKANEITCNRRAEIGSNVKETTCTKIRRPDGISVRVPADFPL